MILTINVPKNMYGNNIYVMIICEIVIVITFRQHLWLLDALHIHTLWCGRSEMIKILIMSLKSQCWRVDGDGSDIGIDHNVHDMENNINKIEKWKRWCTHLAYIHIFIWLDISYHCKFIKRIGLLVDLIEYSITQWIQGCPS